ncbi:hypothetical protein [Streptomyces subrutilus]|uniref:Antibiotic biosynthesis monooxygenase n=1 Tax=Streptomyces subrutilus TaxID=36818 RepID=A0A1E5NXZ7_9ACTN|nr:hypothetical protein [Streptomyces subrutilus]OEJ21085.1 hypothetical protein BGK67_34905 [Streptomyces subrutilus]
MTKYSVVLRFTAAGPRVFGEWDVLEPAEKTYRNWIGLYGSHPTAAIQLVDDTTSPSTVIKEWTRDGGEQTR